MHAMKSTIWDVLFVRTTREANAMEECRGVERQRVGFESGLVRFSVMVQVRN